MINSIKSINSSLVAFMGCLATIIVLTKVPGGALDATIVASLTTAMGFLARGLVKDTKDA